MIVVCTHISCEAESAIASALCTLIFLAVESITEPKESLEDELERVPSVLTIGVDISDKYRIVRIDI